jgi:hypothetical protein
MRNSFHTQAVDALEPRGLQVYTGRSLATAVAGDHRVEGADLVLRPFRRRGAGTPPNDLAACSSNGSGSNDASAC